jgi:hypothetical protein
MLRRSYQGRVKKQSTEDCDDHGIEIKEPVTPTRRKIQPPTKPSTMPQVDRRVMF